MRASREAARGREVEGRTRARLSDYYPTPPTGLTSRAVRPLPQLPFPPPWLSFDVPLAIAAFAYRDA